MNISVIVTNFNGIKLLKKHLSKVIETSGVASEIIIADDCSEDDSLRYVSELQKTNPKIRIIKHSKNVGFGQNSNDAVKKSQGDLVVLLNSDISPEPGYIEKTLPHFKKKNLFGVGFGEIENENYGQIYWQSGYLQIKPGFSGKSHITGWLNGGSSILNKSIFTRLGGFDSVYAPFYNEDLDLGFRAWKSGYTCLWEPTAKIFHQHEATISKFSKRFLDYVKERNRLLTVWRNISDPKMLSENRLAIIGRVLTGPNYIKIIRAAKKQIDNSPPPIVFPVLTDKEIFAKFK